MGANGSKFRWEDVTQGAPGRASQTVGSVWRAQANRGQAWVGGQQPRIVAPPAAVGAEDPPQQAIAAEEVHRQPLPVAGAGPQLLAACAPAPLGARWHSAIAPCAAGNPARRRLRPGPDEVAHGGVVAVDHPRHRRPCAAVTAGASLAWAPPSSPASQWSASSSTCGNPSRPASALAKVVLPAALVPTTLTRRYGNGERRSLALASLRSADGAAFYATPGPRLAASGAPMHNGGPTCRPPSRARFAARHATDRRRRLPSAPSAVRRSHQPARRDRAAWTATSSRSGSGTRAVRGRPGADATGQVTGTTCRATSPSSRSRRTPGGPREDRSRSGTWTTRHRDFD